MAFATPAPYPSSRPKRPRRTCPLRPRATASQPPQQQPPQRRQPPPTPPSASSPPLHPSQPTANDQTSHPSPSPSPSSPSPPPPPPFASTAAPAAPVTSDPAPPPPPQQQQQQKQPPSTLDDLPAELKLNAVAAALARQRDHPATLRVLAEMADSGVPVDTPTQVALLDAAVSDPEHLISVLSRLRPVGYAADVAQTASTLSASGRRRKPDTTMSASSPAGSPRRKARKARTSAATASSTTATTKNGDLEGEEEKEEESESRAAAQLPDPTRAVDLGLASTFLFVVSTSLSAEFIEPVILHHDPVEPTAVLLAVLFALAFDRYATSAVLWKRLSAGLERLLADDPARTARADAASFLIAYRLGLPWLPFRPDGPRALAANVAIEQQELQQEQQQPQREDEPPQSNATSDSDSSDSDNDKGVNDTSTASGSDSLEQRVLLWLAAGPAAELAIDGRLVCTDLRRARAFVTERRRKLPRDSRWPLREVDDRVCEAVAAASQMLQSNRREVDELAAAMLDGASVGECVVLLAGRFETRAKRNPRTA